MAMATTAGRAEREIQHGARLAADDPERLWGWGTPAGRLRAERRAGLILRGAGLGPRTRALEIGCGTGLFTEFFAASGATIVAVDISEALLERARARGLDPARVSFVAARFEDLDAERPFDAIIGSSVLHHLEIGDALPRIARVLVPGGRCSFAEPNMLNPQIFCERHVPFVRTRLHVSPDETAFVRWPLARLLRRHGFHDVRVTPFDWLHPHTPPALIAPVRAAGRVLEAVPGVREFAGSLAISCRRS
jgi:2-polyprenyl-3-methyl-5-hydroxy-6-metoxy-1,4-benzoquinol methylase